MLNYQSTSRVLVAAAIAVAVSVSLAAQGPRPAAPRPGSAPAAPRTADGHPDLQGVYDVATITPLERPANFGTRRALTPQEAAAMEKYEADRQVKNDAPLAADRGAPPVGGSQPVPKSYIEVLENFGGGVVGGYNNFWLAGGTKVINVNGEYRSSIIVDPENGRMPPTNAEARKRNAAFAAGGAARPDAGEGGSARPGEFDGPELRPLSERCLLGFGSTSGPPTLPNYFYNNLKQIVQTPTSIMFLNEMIHDARIVRMGADHLPPSIRKWMGDSVGHWEGDTLVVDTTNFTDKTRFNGASEQLHIVERITRMAPNALLYRFTVEDPLTWDRPWTGEYPWVSSNEQIYEYACHEGNYSLGDMLRGARAQEADTTKSNR